MPYFAAFGAPANSDYFPVLEMNAPLARFTNSYTPDLSAPEARPAAAVAAFRPACAAARPRPDYAGRARLAAARRLGAAGERHTAVPALGKRKDAGGFQRRARERPSPASHGAFRVHAAASRGHAAPPSCRPGWPREHSPAPRSCRFSFWDALGARCGSRLAASDRRWLELHRAVAAGDGAGMARSAEAILEADPRLEPRLFAHAVAAFMAGSILANRPGCDRRLQQASQPARRGAGLVANIPVLGRPGRPVGDENWP